MENCHDCGSAMLPAIFHHVILTDNPNIPEVDFGYAANEVVDGQIWVRCTGCGHRAGWRDADQNEEYQK